MNRPFEPGERALLMDRKERRYLVTLKAGAQFHTHHGFLEHDAIIGQVEGVTVTTTSGGRMVAMRPSLADFILKMPRGAQVVYPKDIGAILMSADIFPGATVLEAGSGSGALALGLLRAIGEHGKLITYEIRDDFHARARANIEGFLGKLPSHVDMRVGDVADADVGEPVDRIVLDLPEPWRVVPLALRSLRAGGIFCSYVPSVTQVSQITEALRAAGFIEVGTTETLVRGWHVEGQAVRPDHRMVAHTGFLTTGRTMGNIPGEDGHV